jgi:HlyD family secretion protein
MTKRLFYGLMSLTLLAAISLSFWFCREAGAEKTYQLAEVSRGDIVNMVSCTGTLKAVGTVEVGTQVSGVLDRIDADFNDRVKKNQILAVLDTVMLRAQVLDAEANYDRALAQLDEAKADHQRNLPLFEKGFISEAEYIPYKVKLKTQEANLKSARANMVRAERNLKYAVIRSPIDGTVIQRNVEEGQTVAASLQAPTLFIIAEDLSKMEIHALVDESDIGLIKEKQRVVFEVQAYPDKQFEGLVRQVRLQPQVVQNVVNYTVVVDAENKNGLLLPGMTATVDFYVEEKRDVLTISNAALRFEPTEEMLNEFRERRRQQFESLPDSLRGARGQRPAFAEAGQGRGRFQNMSRVWIINEEGKPEMTPFRPGSSDGKVTEIVGSRGLQEGSQVIVGWLDEKKAAQSTTTRSRGMGPPQPRLF